MFNAPIPIRSVVYAQTYACCACRPAFLSSVAYRLPPVAALSHRCRTYVRLNCAYLACVSIYGGECVHDIHTYVIKYLQVCM